MSGDVGGQPEISMAPYQKAFKSKRPDKQFGTYETDPEYIAFIAREQIPVQVVAVYVCTYVLCMHIHCPISCVYLCMCIDCTISVYLPVCLYMSISIIVLTATTITNHQLH